MKGQPRRFLVGHQMRGKKRPAFAALMRDRMKGRVFSLEHRRRISEVQRGPLWAYSDKNPDALLTLKHRVIAIYGGACACCAETAYEFLTVDHVNGCGVIARRGFEKSAMVYRRIAKAGTPLPEYRLLCMNCNFAIGKYGRCPHATVLRATHDARAQEG